MPLFPPNYELPKNPSSYLKFADPGEYKFRILSAALMGWETWEDGEPIRFAEDKKPEAGMFKELKHFISCIVWNYQMELIQILTITQKTIQSELKRLEKEPDWGDTCLYDIKVIRIGKDKGTKYTVSPFPKKPLESKIKEAFLTTPCNLKALLAGGQPFSPEWAKDRTLGEFEKTSVVEEIPSIISKDQSFELEDIISGCSAKYKKQLFDMLNKQGIQRVQDLPTHLFDRVKAAAIKKKKEYEEEQSLEAAI